MKTILQLKKLVIIPLLFLVGNVCQGQVSTNVYVKFISQSINGCGSTGYSNAFCGHTSSEMIIATLENRNCSIQNVQNYNSLIENHYNEPHDACGTGTPDPVRLKWLLNNLGKTCNWYGDSNYYSSNSGSSGDLTINDLFNILNQGKAVIVQTYIGMNPTKIVNGISQPAGTHWMVLRQIDFNNNLVYVNDPGKSAGNNKTYSLADFISNWTASQHPWGSNYTNIHGAPRKRCLVIDGSDIAPNQSLSIYGGTVANPKEINVYFKATDFNTTVSASSSFTVPFFNIKNPVTNALITVPSNYISQLPSTTVGTIVWRHFKVDLSYVTNNSNLPTNGYACDIGFDVVAGSTTKHFHGDSQLYFLDPNTLTDIGTLDDKWYDKYVKDGVNYGLFRGGSPSSTTSSVSFNPSGLLTKPQAAAVVVTAGVKLGILNIDTSGTPYADIPPSNPYFKYVQTLKNAGITGTPSNNEFGVNENITQDRFCKWVAMACNITAADINQFQYINTAVNINYTSTDATLQPYVNIMTKTPSIRNGLTLDSVPFIEPLYSPFDYSTVTTSTMPTSYVCNKNVTRDIMAKVMTLAYEFKKPTSPNAQGRSANNTNSIPSDFIAYGEKYDNASITATSTPITPSQQTYSCASGGSITILYNPGSLPQHYYWSMLKNGATLTSNNTQHSSVTFTAPTVSSPTQWKLYTYTANNKGKARETFITINVGGTSGGNNSSPTIQSHSLLLYGATSSSLTASWTRGNGQNCIVTCKELGANAQDVPDSGVVYIGNSNFNTAPTIFNGSDTKVVYTGTGASCTITGLNPNTQYQIAVFEYNGTTPSTVQYNLNNAPITTGSTLQLVNTTPSANFTWDDSLTFQTGQSFVFTNTSTNANTYQWSITPSENISNTTSATTTNITFNNNGQHTLTLIATNTTTGETSTRTHNFYVYNATELMADLQPTNLNFTSPMIGGQNLTITCNVQNNSTASQSYTTHITFVLSSDQIIDASDHFLGQQSYTIGAGESVSISHTATNISNTFSGNYYILAKADYWNGIPNGYVPESNETNNMISKAIVIQAALPDFVALSITPSLSSVTSGQQFSVSGTFRNIGLGNAQANNVFADFYISNDNILSLDDIKINGTIFVSNNNNILYGNSPIISGNSNDIRIPFDTENGSYFIICAIDYSRFGSGIEFNFNVESNENNNFIATPIIVSNPIQPTINASNFSISNISQNSLTLNWTRGNGQGCVVLARANSDLPNKIVDNVSYTSNSNFVLAPGIQGYYTSADGSFSVDNYSYVKLIYDGTASSVNVTGLTPNETYSFIVLEYNGTGGNKNYLQNTNSLGISAHTQGQEVSNSFKRLLGTIVSGATSNIYSPSSVKFFNENNGVIFRNYNGVGLTNDGGLSWNFINNKIINKNNESWLRSSYWLNNGFGWLAFENGSILKTTDFGLNWTEKKLDRSIEDICFINQNIGFVALKSLLNVSGNDGAIYKTLNGGDTWNQIGVFPRRISSVFFLNENLGWATSFSTSSSFDKIFYKTTNGGNTWSQVIFSTNPSQSSILTDLYFTNENNGFAMTVFGWLLKTNNGGASWSMHNIFNVSSTINTYSKIDFVNQQIGYINLQNKKLAKTIDGGLTWSVSDIHNDFPSNSSGSTAEIDAINENIVYVGGISGLLKSSTGGSSNTITLNSIDQSSYCSNQVINLPYNITGVYNPANIFNVEISDTNGNFTTSNIMQSFTSAGSGNINVAIPQNIAVGSGYKLRIVGTSPNIISNVSNAFAITTALQSSISITPATTTICPNTSLSFTAIPTNGGTQPTYTWKKNGVVVGSNSVIYNATGLNNGDIVWAEMVSNQACASNVPVISTPTTIQVTQIDEMFIQAIDNILAASTDIGVQWIRNGQPIAGATSQFYEATQTGFYQFSVTFNGCSVLSDIYQLTTLGTNTNEFDNNSLKVFPNPFNDLLNIEVKEDSFQSFQIIDLQGRLIVQEKISGNSHQINLSSLPQSVYILEIITDKGKQRVKIIKK